MVPDEAQILDVINKDLKLDILNMLERREIKS